MSAYQSFAVTKTGGSHTKHGKGCEDACYNYDGKSLSIAVVADGHGDDNCFRSDTGAKLAVACAANGIREFLKLHEPKFPLDLFKKKSDLLPDDFDKAIRDLVKHIIALWQTKVEEDHTTRPFTPGELEKTDEKHRKKYETGNGLNKAYGTTLIAAAITDDYWFGIHIGDGRLTALYPDGSFDQPVPWDKRCYLNVTTSICDDDAFERARLYFSFHAEKTPPTAVFLCTDGIDDNYPVDGNENHLFKLYRTIAMTFAEDGFKPTREQLNDLANSFATKGKGDDTSIAGFIDMEAVKQAVPIWQKQIAGEEAEASAKGEPGAAEPKPEKPITTDEETETTSKDTEKAIAAYGVYTKASAMPEGGNKDKQ